jgi:hypothetical protein
MANRTFLVTLEVAPMTPIEPIVQQIEEDLLDSGLNVIEVKAWASPGEGTNDTPAMAQAKSLLGGIKPSTLSGIIPGNGL